jgi:molybdate transport system regulatory protein
LAYAVADCGLLSADRTAGIRRVKGAKRLGVPVGNGLTAEQGKRLLLRADGASLRGKRDNTTPAILHGNTGFFADAARFAKVAILDLWIIGKNLREARGQMKISARNVLAGKVQEITRGAVNAQVKILLDGGELVVSVITNSSVESLGMEVGSVAYAIVKASEVIVGKGLEDVKLSARNVLPGTVTRVVDGAVNSEVEIRLPAGTTIAASITKESVKALELKPGDAVSAIVKASNVMIGV